MTRSAIVFLLCAAALVLWYVAAAGGGFPLDDSWIHQTFGRNLALHGEWSFILGHPVAASTSPLYTVLLSIGYRLGVPYQLWTHGLGALALASTAIIGAAWARRALPEQTFAPWVVGLALLATWHHIWAASAGMETLIFGALVLALLVWPWWEGPESRRGRLIWGAAFGVVAACAVLARPEGIVAVGLAGLVLLWHEIMDARERAQERARHAVPLQVLVWTMSVGIAFLLVLMPYFSLNLQLTGGLLPNTAAAKFQQHELLLTLPLLERIQRLCVAILAGGQVVLIPGMVIYVWVGVAQVLHWFVPSPSRAALPRQAALWELARWLLPFAWAVGLIVIYALRLPADYQHGRYVLPALPALVLMGSAGLCVVWDHVRVFRRGLLSRVVVRAWAIVFVMLSAYYVVAGREIYRVDVAIIDGEMVNAAHWIRDNLPEDELLAIHDIGAVGYFAARPMLDIAGLITPDVVPLIGQPEALWALMQVQDARYLLAFPDQIPGGNPFDARLCPLYSTDAAITQQVGHANMQVYRLAWDQNCNAITHNTED